MSNVKLAFISWLLAWSFVVSPTPAETSRRSCSGGRIHKSGKGCKERLNRFLQDVVHAYEDLSWIDQVAHQMHSMQSLRFSPELQEKLNSMFFNSEKQIWSPPKNSNPISNLHQRHRRHSKHPQNFPSKLNSDESKRSKNLWSKKGNLNSSKNEYNARSLLQQNLNSTMKSTQKIRPKNRIATSADPLEEILQSINVFPVVEDRDARDGGVAAPHKFNDDAAESNFQSGLFKHKAMDMPPRAVSNQSFSEGHMRTRRLLELMVLDNEDKAQTKKALNGNLAREIVDAIFDQVKSKGGFSVPIFISENHANSMNSMLVENVDRRELNLKPGNENKVVTNKIIKFVQQMISEEVEKKSCTTLQPELHNFLEWLIDVDIDNNENVDTLRENTKKIIEDKLQDSNSIVNLDEWYQKTQTLKNLLDEYNGLSKKEKNKVHAIYEYLASRFEFAEAYIDAFKSNKLPVHQLLQIHIN